MDFKEAYDDTCSTVGKACRTGNVEALKGLIAAGTGTPVDVKDNRGWFPLHEAAYRQGQPECLEILLQHEDCDVNWKTFEGQTALYLASKIGNIDAIRLLVRHGADVNLTTNKKRSPLWEATEKHGLACMRVLVAAGANINQQTYNGDTPLHWAAERGNTETVTFLLDKGADMNVRADAGRTPVFIASHFAKHECLKIMLEMADQKPDGYAKNLVNAMDTDNATPLLVAAHAGSSECVKLLLDRGANPDITFEVESEYEYWTTETPLLVAARAGSSECVKLLLDRGANPDIKCEAESKYGYRTTETPLLVAARAGSAKCVKLLHGYRTTETPLLVAARAGSSKCVKLLLDRGANADIACELGLRAVPFVPLQMAVFERHPSCVELLAPVTTEVKMDRYFRISHPVRLAIRYDNIRCIKILLDNGYSWKKIYKEILSYSHGANISMDGETEFCYLIFLEDMSFNVVHYFLRLGIMKPSLNNIRINTTTFNLRACRVNTFLLLLKYGANPTVLDSNGVNQVAVEIIRFFHVDLMYALIKYGTKLQFGNEQCWHPGKGCTKGKDRNILALVVLCLCSNIHTDEEVRTKKLKSQVKKIQEASWGLRHACRVKIVRQLISRGNYTTDSVNTLGLPTILEDYILYKDFDEFVYDVDESGESDDDVDDCRISSLGTEMREAFRKLEMVDSTVEMLMVANEKEL